MKKMMLLAAALTCAAAMPVRAAWIYDGTVTVAAGETNGVGELTLKCGTPSEASAGEVGIVAVANVSGYGTGTVVFVACDFGVEYAIATTNGIVPGAKAALWPKRLYVAGSATNAEPYTARRLLVRVTQASTNSTPTVYNVGASAR